MGGLGLIFTPVLVRRLIGPPGLSRPMTKLIATPNSSIGWCNPPPSSHPPPPLIHAIHNITVVVKKVAQNPALLASYKR